MLVVGDKEVDAATVSVRQRGSEQLTSQSFDQFQEIIGAAIRDRTRE